MRPGVKFHDGTSFDAAAVKTNIEYFKGLRKNLDLDGVTRGRRCAIRRRWCYGSTSRILQYRGCSPSAPGMMLSPAALEKYGKDFGQHPVGTGPFMLKEIAAGKSVLYEKFPDYWNKGEIDP